MLNLFKVLSNCVIILGILMENMRDIVILVPDVTTEN